MFSFLKPQKTIVVHNGKYHDDDVFACATLLLVLEKRNQRAKIIRTRDESIIKTADYVCDVGDIYDPATNRFDHHQPEGAGKRENGIPYASFGLVWKQFGEELANSNTIAMSIDQKIVQGIDSFDNGMSVYTLLHDGVVPYTIHDVMRTFRPSWKEAFNIDDAFLKAVKLAKSVLKREIVKLKDAKDAEVLAETDYLKSSDKSIIVLSSFYPWKETISKHPEPIYVIWESPTDKNWVIMAVRDNWETFINRKDMPKAWAGLRGAEFEKVSGIPGALFCHRGVWLATTRTKESAIALAKKALAA